jgi:membrane dipeptidase
MSRALISGLALSAAILASACVGVPQSAETIPGAGLVGPETARIHQQLMTMDTHLDTPANLVLPAGFDITRRNSYDRDGSQVDLPRMNEGGLDGGFWVIYTPQGPLTPEAYRKVRDTAILRSQAVARMVAANPDAFEIALTAADAERIAAAGRKIVYQSIENSYPLGEDLSLLETFQKLGVRMVGPVHNGNNQFADSAVDASGPRWGGLSPLGRDLVREANRLGMILDASHASDKTLEDMIELSKTPVILSHSGTKDLYNHPRNVPDALILKLAQSGGVIQMNALGSYLADVRQSPERQAAMADLRARYGPPSELAPDRYEAYLNERMAVNEKFPEAQATFVQYMEQFLHVLKLVGPDHVGVGADWDGGGGVQGMRDIVDLPKITQRLLEEGYTRDDLQKIWGGNIVRLLKAAETYAQTAGN